MSDERCKHELLPGQCADCRGLKDTDPYEGVLIERFIAGAQYAQPCALFPDQKYEGHFILKGDATALAVHDHPEGPPFTRIGYICDNCIAALEAKNTSGG